MTTASISLWYPWWRCTTVICQNVLCGIGLLRYCGDFSFPAWMDLATTKINFRLSFDDAVQKGCVIKISGFGTWLFDMQGRKIISMMFLTFWSKRVWRKKIFVKYIWYHQIWKLNSQLFQWSLASGRFRWTHNFPGVAPIITIYLFDSNIIWQRPWIRPFDHSIGLKFQEVQFLLPTCNQ